MRGQPQPLNLRDLQCLPSGANSGSSNSDFGPSTNSSPSISFLAVPFLTPLLLVWLLLTVELAKSPSIRPEQSLITADAVLGGFLLTNPHFRPLSDVCFSTGSSKEPGATVI